MIIIKKLPALLLFALIGTTSAHANDKLITMCNDCHGSDGVSMESDMPSIAGISETSISDMLFNYVDGGRPAAKGKFRHGDTTRPETDMIEIAKAMSEEEIEHVAKYYGAKDFTPAKQNFDAELAQKGEKIHQKNCAKCHDDGGCIKDDDASILAGQWSTYLASAFAEYQAKKRVTEDKMQSSIDALSDEQIQALINYYASLQ